MKKKFTPMMWCHLILTAALIILSCISVVVLLTGSGDQNAELIDASRTALNCYIAVNIVNILALICSMIYLSSGFSKKAAPYYKAFLALVACSTVFAAIAHISSQGFGFAGVLLIAKIPLLLILAFGKNMGKRNTWICFYIMLALDLAVGFTFIGIQHIVAQQFISVISRLAMTGAIGLAIKGKYDDKAARGTT